MSVSAPWQAEQLLPRGAERDGSFHAVEASGLPHEYEATGPPPSARR